MKKAAKNRNKKVGQNLLTLKLRAKDNKFSFLWVVLQFTEDIHCCTSRTQALSLARAAEAFL